MPSSLPRIIVVGCSCSGKSTYARSLSAVLGFPRVELDALYWGPEWQPKPAELFRALTAQAVAGERWLVEGNYGGVRDLLWPRATAVIWLNYSFLTVFRRALYRTLKRILTRETLWQGNRESFRRSFLSRESILLWVITSFRRRNREFRALQSSGKYPNLTWVEFHRPAQARAYLQALVTSDGSDPTA